MQLTNNTNTSFIAGQECVDPGPLIDGSIPIPDDHMTASSEWDITLTPLWTALYARMSSATGWCAAQQDIDAAVPSFYLQVSTHTPIITFYLQMATQ